MFKKFGDFSIVAWMLIMVLSLSIFPALIVPIVFYLCCLLGTGVCFLLAWVIIFISLIIYLFK